ncbi:hypothetical protein HN784_00270, partial [bacterium]|nr:hypothetical protein [bacterium]
ASLCEAIEKKGTRDKCFHNVAVRAKDIAVCSNIKNSAEKLSCEKSTTLKKTQ